MLEITTFVSQLAPLPGPGWTRQIGLDTALKMSKEKDDYIVFSDSDDDYTENTSLNKVLQYISYNPNADDIVFACNRYFVNTEETIYCPYRPWEIWSTIYKASFIKKYNLHLAKTCTLMEDAFLTVCRYTLWNHITQLQYAYYTYWVYDNSTFNSVYQKFSPKQELNEILTFIDEYENWEKTITDKKDYSTYYYLIGERLNSLLTRGSLELSEEEHSKIQLFIDTFKIRYEQSFSNSEERVTLSSRKEMIESLLSQ